MFSNFSPFAVETESSVTIRGLQGGSGPPLLLLHGFPQTYHIWHIVAPQLAEHYTLILLDLRGYGSSSKPPASDDHKAYAKSTMARDSVKVMQELGHQKFFICGHDRGARVAHKLSVDYPDVVLKVVLLDICPTLAMYEQTDQAFATAYWHWFFLIQKAPLPEILINQNPRQFIHLHMGGKDPQKGLNLFAKDALEEYGRAAETENAAVGWCEDYRAAATVDLEEQKDDIQNGRKIKCPLRLLWGRKGVIAAKFDALKEWRKVSEAEVSGEAVDSGHYIPEEVPDVLVAHVKEFLV